MQNQIQLSPELLQRLDALAAKLNTTVEHLWNVLLNQAKIEAIQDSINALFGLIFVAVGLYSFKRLYHCWKSDDYYSNNDDLKVGFGILACLGTCTAGTASFFVSLNQLYAPALNPSYWALQQILGH